MQKNRFRRNFNNRPVRSGFQAATSSTTPTPRTLIKTGGVSPAGIEILELNEGPNMSNIEKVKQQLRAYVFMNYKTLGDCIHSMTLEDPEEFEIPEELEDLDPENDKGGLKAHLLRVLLP